MAPLIVVVDPETPDGGVTLIVYTPGGTTAIPVAIVVVLCGVKAAAPVDSSVSDIPYLRAGTPFCLITWIVAIIPGLSVTVATVVSDNKDTPDSFVAT